MVANLVGMILALLASHARGFPPSSPRRAISSTQPLFARGGKNTRKKQKNPFADTILLPQTKFDQRANAIVKEPQIQAFWREIELYQKMSNKAKGAERFVLHDGPPYANGDLHCGHALNKILKDFINRKQLLNGKQVHYVPGWDCHGLPIELKVLQKVKSKERQTLTPVQLREKAAAFARETVDKQSKAFQRYGVYGDFDHPYLTLQPEFEAAQVQVFGDMYKRGFIFRGRKPVHWSPSSKTALAEAELEYPAGHVSKSVYVAFEVLDPSKAISSLHSIDEPVKVAIWTTTPWTIPANLAVAVNPDLDYSVVSHPSTGKLLVATELAESLASILSIPEGESFDVVKTVKGLDVTGTTYKHPLYDRTSPVVAGGDYITTESGTGLVHTAPGHGQEDYQTGLKHELDLLSPVDDIGKFTIEAGEKFVGLSVLGDGNTAVIDALLESGSLLKQEDYGHKYPYDWRTKKPTIFRATDQWFASVQGFRDDALEAIDQVSWVPAVGKNRITAFVSGRGDWCISRQRSWGVPIPVFYDKETGEDVLLDEHTLDHIQKLFREHGSDAWWTMDEEELLPDIYKGVSDKWRKGTDTMDVWFDSGSSWNGVVKTRDELTFPADVYLEGSDQHRGWFQSSLLTSVASNRVAPYKAVLTHGFVLDEKGFKMSKSLGNVVDPLKVIEGGHNKKIEPPYGADVLRLWVASVDYSGDVCIGSNIIKQTFDNYRKLRNTARYLIGNLHDFIPEGQQGTNAVPFEELPSLDKWMLGRLAATLKEVDEATEQFQFNRATQELIRFASADLSNFYLEVAKDRLYISAIDEYRRRSCQTVLHLVLEGFVKALSPFLPHMAEDAWQNLPYETSTASVFQAGWPRHLTEFKRYDEKKWEFVLDLRDDINQLLEEARSNKLVGASLEAAAVVYAPDKETRAILQELDGDRELVYPSEKTNGVDELRTILMLSQVTIVDSAEEASSACETEYVATSGTLSGCTIGISKAVGAKCGRCWFYGEQVGNLGMNHVDVCQRCNHAISVWENAKGTKFARATEPDVQPVA